MYVYMTYYLGILLADEPAIAALKLAQIDTSTALPHTQIFFVLLMTYLFAVVIDLVFAMIGYLIVLRPLDSDIRSVDSTITGWICCLVCYFPFWELFVIQFIAGEFYGNPAWYVWFADHAVLLTVWGSAVILAMTMESLATVSFGLRFSNLTYRGLISNGPFRFTKHPQYVAKMCNRFLFYVPFLSMTGLLNAAWQCALFGGIAFVYYLRARTEENHLSRYPEYVEYARWIDEHGIFRFLGKLSPVLKFNPERAQAGKLLPVF
jgi:isoprenylcysteine carboxyl methyltransferase (ICMT) family protein YpbQ